MTRHHYGKNVHVLADPFLESHLASLCSPETFQPEINQLVSTIYQGLLSHAVNRFFPLREAVLPTRMTSIHPDVKLHTRVVDPQTRAISVNLARAGTLPSHTCYTALNYLMNPSQVRQDHISIGRTTDAANQVTGAEVGSLKIGGPVEGSIVLFPDPMAATGGTLVKVLDLYKSRGKALKFIALHCIVTPEYLKNVTRLHPDLEVIAVRLDRGLSPPEVLATEPGLHWDKEKGLNENQYIVPGGGGFGEIMNNAEV
jgi:uracil phosphoribosyltransferase